MSWGISDSAPQKEKIKADVNDSLQGMNSCGEIGICTYDKLYDIFENALDKMFDIVMKFSDDSSYVIYDIKRKVYFCGHNQWNKNIRNAQFFHSKRFLLDRVKTLIEQSKVSHSGDCPLSVRNIRVKEVKLIVSKSLTVDEYNKLEVGKHGTVEKK